MTSSQHSQNAQHSHISRGAAALASPLQRHQQVQALRLRVLQSATLPLRSLGLRRCFEPHCRRCSAADDAWMLWQP